MCFLYIFLAGFIFIPGISNSQSLSEKDSTGDGVDPILALNKFVKYSKGNVKNKLFYDGKLFGYKSGEKIFIRDFLSQESFEFETENYDSVQFYYEWDDYVVDGFFLKVYDNESFTYVPIPVQDLTGLEMIIGNIKKYKGKKLYELKLTDDVDPDNIEVSATNESVPYINIVKIDSSNYQVKLKDIEEFNLSVSQEIKDRIKKGLEVIIPIGVIMKDKVIKSDVQEYKIYLRKNKKPKSKS